jgi:hypothetical protein
MPQSRRALILTQIGILLLGISGSIYAALTPANSLLNWYSTDDAFFYYQVARNVVEGRGFSFDGFNLTNGYHPLWMLVCIAVFWLSRFHLLLPLRVLILVSGLFNGLTGVILFRLLRRHLHPYAAVLGALVWMLLPTIFDTYTAKGLETPISILFIVLLLYRAIPLLEPCADHKMRDFLALGALSALTILGRLDNVFLVGMIGVFVVFRITRIRRLVIYDMVAILIASILAWVLRFGTIPTYQNSYSVYPLLLTSLALIPLVLFFGGFYSSTVVNRTNRFVFRFLIAALVALLAVYGAMMLLRVIGFELLISRLLTLLVVGMSMAFIAVIHFFYKSQSSLAQSLPLRSLIAWLRHDVPSKFRNGLVYSLPIAALVGGYMLLNQSVFGSASPVSGQVKHWWGTLADTAYKKNDTLLSLLGLAPGSGNSPWFILTTMIADAAIFVRNLFAPDSEVLPLRLFLLFVFVFFVLIVYLLSRRDGYLARKSFSLLIPAIAFGCFLQIAYYAATGYGHSRSWYWAAESLVLVMLGAVFSSKVFEKVKELTKRIWPGYLLLMVATGILIFMQTRYLVNRYPFAVPAEEQDAYVSQVRALERETPEGSLIGMTGGGETAYFIENRTIVNLDGLINSTEYFAALKAGTAGEYLEDMGLDYVFGNEFILLESTPYRDIFTGRLRAVKRLVGHDNFMLYEYLNDQ